MVQALPGPPCQAARKNIESPSIRVFRRVEGLPLRDNGLVEMGGIEFCRPLRVIRRNRP